MLLINRNFSHELYKQIHLIQILKDLISHCLTQFRQHRNEIHLRINQIFDIVQIIC